MASLPPAAVATTTRKVAIIGAGSAGLAAALELLTLSHSGKTKDRVRFEPRLFERRPHLGGIWQYDDPGECSFVFDERGAGHPVSSLPAGSGSGSSSLSGSRRAWPPSPMYEGLRTNIPRDLMCFRDFPDERHDEQAALFPSRGTVQSYIEAFAAQKELLPFIRFNTDVVSVHRIAHRPGPIGPQSKWAVVSRALDGSSVETREEYDYVVVAAGRCNRPKVPLLPGLWLWKGKLLHSAWYRTPTVFRGQSVLVVGNNSSGMDIARELHGKVVRDFDGREEWIADAHAQPPRTGVKVRQSVEDITKPPPMDYDPRDEASPEWSKAIEVVPRISRIERAQDDESSHGRVILEDGRVLDDVDTIIFATGFSYEFPMLDQSLAPFDEAPVMLPPPDSKLSAVEQAELEQVRAARRECQGVDADKLPRASPFLSNLDDWQLFHRRDPSIVFLGIPTSIVPFPFAQIQARYAAYFWAGLVPALPALDPSLPVTDAAKWNSPVERADETEQQARSRDPVQHIFGHPSESAYLDQLLERMQGEAAFSPVDALETDGKGKIGQRGPELNFQTTKWRRERRANGKALRREELGY
ncbi:monooxygenase [Tilletia horrida]|nr:monooxygenase [Tilletia horrida]